MESAHTFSVDSFSRMAMESGWAAGCHWISPMPQFAVFELAAAECV